MSVQLLEAKLQNEAVRPSKSSNKVQFAPALPLTPPADEDSDDPCSYENEGRPAHTEALASPRPESLVAVIGVGYVGTHLVEAFARVYNVLAFDVSESRLRDITQQFKGLSVRCTSHAPDLAAADCFLVSVPTTLNPDKTIDTAYLRAAVATVEKHARPGSTVIVESSVSVGMTREFLGPLVASKGLKVGMSPERVDPGRKFPAFETIPKVISGLDTASLDSIRELYGRVFETLVPVSSPEVAEMTKLYENCQRMVCAAYANEMADACHALGLDAWEVSRAAASKPFGYQPFRPGPGIGGHCIPVNPYYLLATCPMPLLQHAAETAARRPADVARRLMAELLDKRGPAGRERAAGRAPRPRVLVVGAGFKRGQSVLSNSPGVGVVTALLNEFEVYVEFADPLVAQEALSFVPKMDTAAHWRRECLEEFDGIVVAVDQLGLDMSLLERLPGVVVHNYCPATPSVPL